MGWGCRRRPRKTVSFPTEWNSLCSERGKIIKKRKKGWGGNGEMLVKGLKVSVMQDELSPGDLMYSMETIANTTI